ncbi:MAG TPA: sialidase family protein [Mycobacteriales bacterium]|nr:sialidase family protein [Mycobacteriales bacterium]
MRRSVWLAGSAAGVLAAVMAVPSSGATGHDRTAPFGKLGFTTLGMGTGPSYGEPSFTWAPDGRHGIICTPGSDKGDSSTVQFWYTADGGKTFKHSKMTSPNGGGDCDVDFLPDGTAVAVDLEISDSYLQESTDWGKTWKQIGTFGTEQDRQWLAHSADGTKIYMVYHDFAAEAEFYAVADYDKKTKAITIPPQDCCHSAQSADQASAPGIASTQINPVGPGSSTSLVDEGGNTFSGPILIDPSDQSGKTMYVVYSISDAQSNLNPNDGVPPYGPTRGVIVATTRDGGTTWSSHYAVAAPPNPDGSQEETNGAIFPWGSIDKAGTIYVVYNSTRGETGDHFHQYYVYSKDHGVHWSKPVKLDKLAHGHGAAIYATSDSGRKGQLAVAWYQTDNGTPSSTAPTTTWTPHVALITAADTSRPKIVEQPLSKLPNHKGGICLQGILCGIGPGSSDRSLLDYFQVVFNPKTGKLGIAYADNGGFRPNEGRGEVVFARQTR